MKHMDTVLKLGLMAAVVSMAIPDISWAGSALQTSVDGVKNGITNMPVVVSGVAYTTGAALLISGALKLKAHADNPGSAPLAAGLTRLGVGGGLASVPTFVGWLQDSLSVNNSAAVNSGQVLRQIQ